jgi:hypothetical protein|tara:strand:- start:901 stop:1341 length:441 start_codon:yes stop_codon:yes gene_type:complete
MSNLNKIISLPFLGILLLLLTQAKCDSSHQNIPYVPVNFDINLNLPAYNSLNFPSEHLLIAGGSNGLIIYRYTMDEFVVLDRHSTFDIPLDCQVTVGPDGVTLSDGSECSESQWLILDGSVMQGPALLPLHRYRYSWNPPILHVYN